MLVDSAVVEGKKPAAYFSRGEGGAFYSALAVEELDSNLTNRGPRGHSSTGVAGLSEEDELARDVAAREEERNRRVNPRGGSPGIL